MTWIETTGGGCVNSAFVVRIERVDDGGILYLTTGDIVRSSQMFEVIDGALTVVELLDDDDADCPF